MSVRGLFTSTLVGLLRRPLRFVLTMIAAVFLTVLLSLIFDVGAGSVAFKALFVVCMLLSRAWVWIAVEHHT